MINKTPTIDMNSVLADFAESSRKKQVSVLKSFRAPNNYSSELQGFGTAWDLPSFNFGGLDDQTSSPDAWTKDVWDATWHAGLSLIEAGKFRLPYEECVYLFHFAENASMCESVNLIHLVTNGDDVIGEIFFRQPHGPSGLNGWTKSPSQFTIINGETIEWAVEPAFAATLTPEKLRDYSEDCKASYTKAICATVLLSQGAERSMPSERTAVVNRGRVLGKLAPLPDTVTVRFDHAAIGRHYEGAGTGGHRQPHNRRGHYRTLRSGKVIPVSSSRIHGGAEERQYDVRP